MSSEKLFELINGLIVAVSRILWPIAVFLIVLLFKKDIRALLQRLRKGKLFGQELELDSTVEEFRKSTELAQIETAPQIPPSNPTIPEPLEVIQKARLSDKDIVDILDAADSSPEVAVMKLAAVLERETRALLGFLGLLPAEAHITAVQALRLLTERNFLPRSTTDSLQIFMGLRNKIVHGHAAPEPREILSILDTGISLLRTIQSIPHETYYVFKPDISLYEDPQCSILRNGVVGIVIETHSAEGTKITNRIFPTTKKGYYKNQKRVSWEWSFESIWGKTWYRDLETGEPCEAWSSSAEFVGRHVDEL